MAFLCETKYLLLLIAGWLFGVRFGKNIIAKLLAQEFHARIRMLKDAEDEKAVYFSVYNYYVKSVLSVNPVIFFLCVFVLMFLGLSTM